jgi:hypothetical protein
LAKETIVHAFYKKLLQLYPAGFNEQFGESMEQTFNDLYREGQAKGEQWGFVAWTFLETTLGIIREHVLLITKGDMMKNMFMSPRATALIGSILLVAAFLIAPLIYLVGNLRDSLGPLGYDVADFLYGPVWAASLISVVYILREQMGRLAPRRMSLALLATVLAAGTMVLVACVRSANRQYHIDHPELHLESSQTVLIVWTTLVAGLTGAAWHFLGWALVLIGSAGWASQYLPRLLSIFYFAAGITSLSVYRFPENEGLAGLLCVIVIIWQGILLWKARPDETQAPETT